MGHAISAIVTCDPVAAANAALLDLTLIDDGPATIVPLDAAHSDHWAQALSIPAVNHSDIPLDNDVTREFARRLGLETFALIQTEYFGGVGEQAATVYSKDARLMPPKTGSIGPINEALRVLGVRPKDGMDEFDTIGLGWHRSFEHLFETYWQD